MNFSNTIKSLFLIFLSILFLIISKYYNIFTFIIFIPIFLSFNKFPKISQFTIALYFIGYFFIYDLYHTPITYKLLFILIAILILVSINLLSLIINIKYNIVTFSSMLIIFDYILYKLWGTLFIFTSNISNEHILKISTFSGPQTILTITLLFQMLLIYRLHKNKKKLTKIGLFYLLIIFITLLFSYMNNFTTDKVMNFIIINFNKDKKIQYIKLINKYLPLIKKSYLKNSIMILPSINMAFNNNTEKAFFNIWGEIAKKYSIYTVFGCKDLFFNYNIAPFLSTKGQIIEISEQKNFFPLNYNIDKGDYTLFIDMQEGNIGILINEEIFFKKPADFLTKIGSNIIINPQKNLSWLTNKRIINAIKLNAILNKQSIISNINNKLILAIDANGHTILEKTDFTKHPIKIVKLELPEGKSFSRYQQWGDLLPYMALITLLSLIIKNIYLKKSIT